MLGDLRKYIRSPFKTERSVWTLYLRFLLHIYLFFRKTSYVKIIKNLINRATLT